MAIAPEHVPRSTPALQPVIKVGDEYHTDKDTLLCRCPHLPQITLNAKR